MREMKFIDVSSLTPHHPQRLMIRSSARSTLKARLTIPRVSASKLHASFTYHILPTFVVSLSVIAITDRAFLGQVVTEEEGDRMPLPTRCAPFFLFLSLSLFLSLLLFIFLESNRPPTHPFFAQVNQVM
jgi:hypothetical protein